MMMAAPQTKVLEDQAVYINLEWKAG